MNFPQHARPQRGFVSSSPKDGDAAAQCQTEADTPLWAVSAVLGWACLRGGRA